MYTKVRKINCINVGYGLTDDNEKLLKIAASNIFVAKDEEGHYGIIKDDESVFLTFEYDSITPLGFSLWLTQQKGKVGAFQLSYTENRLLFVSWQLACEYDYIYAEHDCVIRASKYSIELDEDITDVYFPKLDIKISDAWCETISWDYYYISEDTNSPNKKCFLLNAKDGNRYILDRYYVVIGSKQTEDKNLFIMLEDCFDSSGKKWMILRIHRNGFIEKTKLFDGIPIVVYEPDKEGMDEAQPVAFLGEHKGVYYYIDSDLKEYALPFTKFSISTNFSGKNVFGERIEEILCEIGIRNRVYQNSRTLNDHKTRG